MRGFTLLEGRREARQGDGLRRKREKETGEREKREGEGKGVGKRERRRGTGKGWMRGGEGEEGERVEGEFFTEHRSLQSGNTSCPVSPRHPPILHLCFL